MRTARLLPVSPSMHCSGMGVGGGLYLPKGGTLSRGVPAWGVYLVPVGCTCPGTPPLWTEFLTHASENITLSQTSFAGGKNCLCFDQKKTATRTPRLIVSQNVP